MGLQVVISDVKRLSEGIFLVTLNPENVSTLGPARSRIGSKSVVVLGPQTREDTGSRTLMFNHDDAYVLSLGTTSECILVIDSATKSIESESMPSQSSIPNSEFLVQVPSDLQGLARQLLNAVSAFWRGRLLQRGRRWIASPDNYWTVTVQPRDQSLAITVRGRPHLFDSIRGPLEVIADRPGYSRFKIRNRNEVEFGAAIIRRASIGSR